MAQDMSNSRKNIAQRLVELEQLRTRRRTLKTLLIGSGALTGGGLVLAQQSNGAKVVPAINLLLEGDQCPSPETPPAEDPASPTPGALVLNESNYTGTASRQFAVTYDNDCQAIITATASACVKVNSSNSTTSNVDLDLIIILEGLDQIDPMNESPAIETYVRQAESTTPAEDLLFNRTINNGGPDSYTAREGSNRGIRKSCGFLPDGLDYSLRIENNLPIMALSTQTRTANENGFFGFTVPSMTIRLAPGACTNPLRDDTPPDNPSCPVGRRPGPNDDVGIIMLTTPDPGASVGPIG